MAMRRQARIEESRGGGWRCYRGDAAAEDDVGEVLRGRHDGVGVGQEEGDDDGGEGGQVVVGRKGGKRGGSLARSLFIRPNRRWSDEALARSIGGRNGLLAASVSFPLSVRFPHQTN